MVSATPIKIFTNRQFRNVQPVKQPDATAISVNESAVPDSLITDLLFEDIGGIERATIARHDAVSGTDVNYSIVSNVDAGVTSFAPESILSGSVGFDDSSYQIDLLNRLSPVNLTDGSLPGIMINQEGSLILDFLNMEDDEYVEVEILSMGRIYTLA